MNILNYDENIRSYIKKAREYKNSRKRGRQAFCKEMLTVAKELKDDNFLGFAHYHMGECLYSLPKQQKKSLYHIKKAVTYGQRVEDAELLARSYNMLAIDAANRGLAELALEYQMFSRTQAHEVDSPELLAMVCFNIGYSFMDMGDENGALKYFKESYRYCKKCGKKSPIALFCRYSICCVAGMVYIKKGNIDRADKMMKEVLSLEEMCAEAFPFLTQEPFGYVFKMRFYMIKGETEKFELANERFLDALQDGKLTIDALPDVIIFCQQLAEEGDVKRIEPYISRLSPLIKEVNIPHLNMSFYKMMVIYYEACGDETKQREAVMAFYENTKLQQEERKEAFSFYSEMMETVEQIRLDNIRLIKQARTDMLTQLPNRLDLNDVAEQWFERARAEQKSLGIEIMDVDMFKEYNDTFGHQVGDMCLEAIGKALQEMADENTYVARYGGDEFFLCYYDMTDEEILKRARKLKDRMNEIRIATDEKDIVGISVSQGIRNTVPTKLNRVWDYLYAADNALYRLKENNRGDILLIHKAVMSHKSLKDAIIDT